MTDKTESASHFLTVEAPDEALLVMLPEGRRAYPVRPELVLGRGDDASIAIEHRTISRRHARVRIGKDITVEDLGSKNGTRVRGQALRVGEPVTVAAGEPFMLGRVVCVVRRASDASRAAARARATPAGNELDEMIEMVAQSDISVVLHGETGSGKEVTARRIHDASRRKDGPFIGLNCAALPEQLLESELFGYEKGAFSGADKPKPGLFEAADGGTLFLDEIADIPAGAQVKLLRVLEERKVQRLGALKPKAIDVRFISASHKNLDDEVDARRFREDLFFRVNGIRISIPPLRERTAEIEGLALRFLRAAADAHHKPPPAIAPETLEVLRAHTWPGNIRELKNVMERACLLAAGAPTLLPQHVPFDRVRRTESRPATPHAYDPLADRATQKEHEKARIVEALRQAQGNQGKAAELLGISRRTLINRLDEYQIPRPRKA